MYHYVYFAISLLRLLSTVDLQGYELDPPTCGQVCHFDRQYKNADCSSIDLRDVPTSDSCQSARMLDLSYNKITTLNDNGMLGYNHVEHLDLSNNVVFDMKHRFFSGCYSAIYIYLSSNRIAVLQNEVFAESNGTLQQLHLDRNKLADIESGALKYLGRLTHLFLSHNRLESLHSLVFQDLRSLKSLYLNSNRLTSLPENLFANLNRLQNLDLSNNELLVLSDELFSSRCQLVTFVLANNRLSKIPNPSSSRCLNRLQTLDVRNNNINDASNITQYILTTEKLFIDNNRFHCDCNLEDVRIWIQQEVTSRTSSELSCIMPTSGESRLIRSLPDLCPTTTAPSPTSTSSQSTPEEDNQRATLSTSTRPDLTKSGERNRISKEDDAEDEKPPTLAAEPLTYIESPLSYYGLVVVIMVVAILVLIILVSIIMLLAICLCQTNRKVEKMTEAILKSKIAPETFKHIVSSVKKYGSPTVPTENREKQTCEYEKDETPRKRECIPDQSTPKDARIDMSGVRKRTPQSTDKMIHNNSPNKIINIKNDQNARKNGDNCISSTDKTDEEKRPFKRKLGNQFGKMTEDHQETDGHGIVDEIPSNLDGNDIERVNAAENCDYDKENYLNQSFQTKDSENDRQNEEKDVKVRLLDTPQKCKERKLGVLKESNRDNLNLTSSNC